MTAKHWQFCAILGLVMASYSTSPALAVQYDFLTVTGNGLGGNLATSAFTSSNGNGVINVSHVFSAGGEGPSDNINTAIFPSQFTTLFPGTGQVQGHLAQTKYDNTSLVTFDLTGYNFSPSTAFGIWNTTSEATQPAYRVQLLDSTNTLVNPSILTLIGNQDNQTQVAGKHQLTMLPSGDLVAGAVIGSGIHTDAAFWKNIPAGTKEIRVYGTLSPLPGNIEGDGVGYYFAEPVVPEPSSMALLLCGGGLLLTARWRRSR